VILRSLLLALSGRPRVGAALERLPATRTLVRRFVAGTTPGDALQALAAVCARGLMGAVTYLGENVTTEAAARAATDVYLELLEAIHARALPVTPSLKLTHLGLDVSPAACEANVARVLERAGARGTRVWIDMEGSRYTDRTLATHGRLRAQHPNVACVVQAALRRTPVDVDRLVPLGAALRLCKGAYREPPALAYPRKHDVDLAYVRLTDRLLAPDAVAAGVYAGFATHDERMQRHALERARAAGVPADGFELQMLTGIRPDLHEPLRRAGAHLRVLVPFGGDWFGYFMRRLAERPANVAFLLRSLGRPRRA